MSFSNVALTAPAAWIESSGGLAASFLPSAVLRGRACALSAALASSLCPSSRAPWGLAVADVVALPSSRDVLVTRPASLIFETDLASCPSGSAAPALSLVPSCALPADPELPAPGGSSWPAGALLPGEDRAPFFVDWLSIEQTHSEGGLPCVDAGCVISTDPDGSLEWKTVRAVQHEGSFDTSIQVRSDGYRVRISGNLSRFGRPDNLFGLPLSRCLVVAARVLAHYGLPAFTAGQRVWNSRSDSYAWTGARISRIDLTANFSAGSPDDAHAVMQYLGSQHAGRHTGRVLGDGETVEWGRGSRRQYWKTYIKHKEMARHNKAGHIPEKLIQYARDNGIIRLEGTLRSNSLTDIGSAFLGDYLRGDRAMSELIRLFDERVSVISRAEKTIDDLADLPRTIRATARDYLAGENVADNLPKATFYRHRAQLLPYGIDIAVRNVLPFATKVKVINVSRLSAPHWYDFGVAA